jgi:predicted phosphodiesterase
MTSEWRDNFGQAEAVDDYGRWSGTGEDDDELYVETEVIKIFLQGDHARSFIVGTKGSGKSMLLFKKAVEAHRLPGVLAIPGKHRKAFLPTADFANIVSWSDFRQLGPERSSPMQSAWALLWEWALGITVLTHAYHSPEYGESKSMVGLRDRIAELVQGRGPADPFQLISEVLHSLSHKGRPELPQSSPIMDFISQNYGRLPPIRLFIDNQDDFFDDSPEYWIHSGCGLVQAILQIRTRSGQHIQGFTTLRPEVEWSLQNSAHYPRWKGSLFYLHWNRNDLREVFTRRAARLKGELLAEPAERHRSPELAFFGSDGPARRGGQVTIGNNGVSDSESPSIREEVLEYVLRHTLERPREMIIHGNSILDARLLSPPDLRFSHDTIRTAVNESATVVAIGYLAEVGHRWPWNHDGATSLTTFITRYLNRNIISRAEALAIQREFAQTVGQDPDKVHPFCHLASFGLVGWPHKNPNGRWEQFFLTPGTETLVHVPGDTQVFLIHPILYGKRFGVVSELGIVIGRGLPWTRAVPPQLIHASGDSGPCSTLGVAIATESGGAPSNNERHNDRKNVIRIAHLSDLHFTVESNVDEDSVLSGLVKCIRNDAARHGEISLVALTGDIAYSGRPTEFARARQWIQNKLLPGLKLRETDLMMVPGNHDVDRTKIADGARMIQDTLVRQADENSLGAVLRDEEQRKLLLGGHRAWLQFQAEIHGGSYSGDSTPWWSRVIPVGDKTVGFAGFCSSLFSRSDTDHGRLVIGRWQVLHVINELEDCDVIVGMMHHPLSYLSSFDQSRVQELLSRRCDILLRGHLHEVLGQTMVRPNGDGTLELASGACYAGAEFANLFQIVEIDVDAGKVSVRLYVWDGYDWIVHRNAFGGQVPDGVATFVLQNRRSRGG